MTVSSELNNFCSSFLAAAPSRGAGLEPDRCLHMGFPLDRGSIENKVWTVT
jgi:hypothetical protein